MPSQPQITFHDIPCTLEVTWSPHTTKTLLCLHHLHLPYTHNLIPYPDIARTLQSLDVPPAPDTEGKPIRWTLPAITLTHPPTSTALKAQETIMGSDAIAHALSDLAGAPQSTTLFPPRAREAAAAMERAIDEARAVFWKHVIPFVPAMLGAGCASYFRRTRGERFGDLDALRREALAEEGTGTDGLRGVVRGSLGGVLRVYGGFAGVGRGDFVFGNAAPSYPDYCFVAMVQWLLCARHGERESVLGALEDVGGGRLRRVFGACEHLLGPRLTSS